MPPLPNKESILWFGLLALFIIGTALTTYIQEFIKKKIRSKSGFDRRQTDDRMFERFLEAIVSQGESSLRVVEELRRVGENISEVSRSLKDKMDRSIDDHSEIIDRIENLDVPRRHHH